MGAYYYGRVPQDVRQWAVYAAEESLEPGAAFADEREVRSFLDRILTSEVWHKKFPSMTDIELIIKTRDDGHTVTFSAGPSFG